MDFQFEQKVMELQNEINAIDADLEKEKGKRLFILVASSVIVVGYIIYKIGVVDIMELIAISLVIGTAIPFLYIGYFLLVTSLFTNIDSLKARMDYLYRELHKYKSAYGNANQNDNQTDICGEM